MTRTAVPHRTLAALLLLLAVPLAACAPQPTDADGGYSVVRLDITYTPADQRDRQWRALMTAMDRCHQGGFTDAQPAHPPQTRCLETAANGCTRFAAHLVYDCIGMGYQQN